MIRVMILSLNIDSINSFHVQLNILLLNFLNKWWFNIILELEIMSLNSILDNFFFFLGHIHTMEDSK